ncbi:HlyC/CorC family transporter [Rhodococcus triatomae]|uniref:Hemolysin, contains CBS domains n=1 Tax=Rhodococcus triatomae TaxID=300028 RepID=A0A1G8QJ33_9NOCA|nr:hemolysin family protein [Rhodococcus triatomae]QNG20656.1 HlyC/CorC family transporter [Rhodococcus triatomae]QNG23426.1 HlyC/CorC family transporter [Rhodococcus triatomae]SDJ04742.1 Hemolysin, contains CBS domains [Rhodococcus triatomae]
MTALSILFGLFVVLAITALTGYFVAQEFAYMSVDRSRLKARAAAGDAGAARALTVTRRTSFMLSGAQLGITVTGLLVGYVAEPLIGRGLGELMGGVGVPTTVGIAVGAILAVAFSTLVQMLFGELFPKNLAIARPEPVARRLALSTTLYLRLFGWLIWLFDQSSNLLLRALRIEPVHDVEHSATARDLEHIVAESRDTGELPRELSTLLDRVLDFPTRTAEHAMIARSRVDTVPDDQPITEVLERMSTGHTRYPVVGDTVDDLLGVVHLHDLLGEDVSGTARSRARAAVIVPASLSLVEVLTRLAEAQDEMALVVDEYGGFAGVVTVEDIAEELVGEIADEHDPAVEEDVRGSAAEGWTMPGDLHLDEVERVLGHKLPEVDAETLAGLVIARYGGLPQVGTAVRIELPPDPADLAGNGDAPHRVLVAEVREIGKHVPSSLNVRLEEEAEADDE